jgi:hypothetical protein
MNVFDWILLIGIVFFVLVTILLLFGMMISEIYKTIDKMETGPHDILDQKEKE